MSSWTTYLDWNCPFYKWDEGKILHCEAGKISFPDVLSAKEYYERYCCARTEEERRQCTLCNALYEHYEQEDKTR